MFRQHKITCENKEILMYLFLYDQEIDVGTMKTIFSQLAPGSLQQRIVEYIRQNRIRFQGTRIKLVYCSTIIKDFCLPQSASPLMESGTFACNVISFER